MDYQSPPKPDTDNKQTDRWGSPIQGMSPEPEYKYEENPRDYKHSGPGIASFVIAMVTLVCYAIAFVYTGAKAAKFLGENNKLLPESAEIIMYLGISVLILVALNVIGTVTGIVGLTFRQRRKVFAVLGTIINAIFVLLFMLLLSMVLVNAGAA